MTMTRMQQWCTVMGLVALGEVMGCHELTGSQALPAGTQNPAFYDTPSGALSMRNAAIANLEYEIPRYITDTGLLTDELESSQTGASPGVSSTIPFPVGGSLDERILPELTTGGSGPADLDYLGLQAVRGGVLQALGALAAYDTAANVPTLRGELYALDGYAEILLADFFCSGVPLSTLDFQGDYTYHASSNTTQIYQDAITREDSALTLAGANDTIQALASVLKGRALLDLGEYAQAAQAVASVPDGFQSRLDVQWTQSGSSTFTLNKFATVSNLEGSNGLPFLAGGDPRTPTMVTESVEPNLEIYIPLTFPLKYNLTGYSHFTVADGIEAQLIQAEAALQLGDVPIWLTRLNQLRKTATVPGQTVTPLDTLTDPGASLTGSAADSARLALTFQERAYWLFLTGHRQGDLRRLVREYGRSEAQVYPVGPYLAPGQGTYGTDVTAPIPAGEYANPLFHGCLDRGA
jgi:hypothetical protein